MRYDQIIYYPPFERHSLLLQVTCGCSYNQCAFCNMYKTVDFEVIPLKQIIADLKDASGYNPYTERVFLVGGEPLCLPFEQMKEILTQIKKYLPYCACVSMYASIKICVIRRWNSSKNCIVWDWDFYISAWKAEATAF